MKKIVTLFGISVFSILLVIVSCTTASAQNTGKFNPYEFVNICGDIYYEFNKNEGPDPEALMKSVTAVQEHAADKEYFGNDLYAALQGTLVYGGQNTELAYQSIVQVMDLAVNKYKMIYLSPYWFLSCGELLLRGGNYQEALEQFEKMKGLHMMEAKFQTVNDSFLVSKYINEPPRIADFYIACCNDKISKTDKNMENFKRKYPGFWRLK